MPSLAREEAQVQLTQNHLPKLDDEGWVDYDPRTGDVRYAGHERVKTLLGELRNIF